jgi:hypothetical protein
MKPSFFLLILLNNLLLSCNVQNNNADKGKLENGYTFLTYGLPDMERQNSRNIISKKWGINFKSVAGCMVSEELVDSIKLVNEKVDRNIELKFGKDWNTKFEKEIGEEFEKEKIVTQILDKVDFIKKKDDQMHLEGNGLHYYMTPIENSTDYNVSVEGWGKIKDKDTWVSYYRMTVNYKTKNNKLLDDKMEAKE